MSMYHLIGVHRSEKLTGIHLSLGSVAPLRLESASVNGSPEEVGDGRARREAVVKILVGRIDFQRLSKQAGVCSSGPAI